LAAGVLTALLWTSSAMAASLTVMWDPHPDPDVAGYIVYVGSAPGAYAQTHDIGGQNFYTVSDPEPGRQYCFAVAAYLPGPLVGPRSAAVCGYSDRPPVLQPPGNVVSVVGEPAALQLHGFDPDGRSVWYGATGVPPGIALTPSTGLLAGIPTREGTFSVLATVHDGTLTASQSFTWRVDPVLAPTPTAGIVQEPAPAPVEEPVQVPEVTPEPVDSAPGAGAPSPEPDADPPADPPATPAPLPGAAPAPLTITDVRFGPNANAPNPLALVSGLTAPGAGVTEVTWTNGHRTGRATGTTTWSARIPLFHGDNEITIAARVRDGTVHTQMITVRRIAPTEGRGASPARR
jgi:hypothetical protein